MKHRIAGEICADQRTVERWLKRPREPGPVDYAIACAIDRLGIREDVDRLRAKYGREDAVAAEKAMQDGKKAT